MFRKFCTISPEFKDFHFPSTLMPSYESQKEEILSMYNKDGFAREILAEFYEDSSKVFSTEDIRNSFVDYNYINHYNELENPNDWITTVGENQRSLKIKINRW